MTSTWLLEVLKDADFQRKSRRKRGMDEDEEEIKPTLILTVLVRELCTVPRAPSLFRKRWDDQDLVNLTVNDDSFVIEYRRNPTAFDILLALLLPRLTVNEERAKLAIP